MIAETVLGARLALASGRGGRGRSVLTAFAALAGTTLTLAVFAVAAADRAAHPERYADGGMRRVVGATVVVIGLQVAGLTATAGRLAAGLRARRLANLRLLGLSARRTRTVVVAEAGVATLAGALAGVALFEAVRPLLARVNVAGVSWTAADLDPGGWVRVGTVVAIVGFTVAVAALPDRLAAESAVARVRRADSRRPSWWRLLPLAAGAAVCAAIRIVGWGENRISLMLLGVALTGIGVVVVVPVFVRLTADALVHAARGPVATIAGRRLQTQPTSMNRVVTGLLLGLFIVTGARLVVVAFESTPQYRGAASQVQDRQLVSATVDAANVPARMATAHSVPGVRDVLALPRLAEQDCPPDRPCADAIVATCDQLAAIAPSVAGCRSDRVTWIRQPGTQPTIDGHVATMVPLRPGDPAVGAGSTGLPVPVGDDVITVDEVDSPFGWMLLIPPGLTGVHALVAAGTSHLVIVTAEPGRDLAAQLTRAGFAEQPFAPWDVSEYDTVASLRAAVLAVGLTVLAVGLLAFAIAAIDRALQRRRDVAALQRIGVPANVLRRVQWIEAAVPTLGGSVLAVAAGVLAGSAYLSADRLPLPWPAIATVTAAAALGGVIVAGLTVAAASPTIAEETVRRE